jgi:hypothetical protein
VAGFTVSAGVGSVAHGIHYALLGLGLIGLVALLAPRRATQHDEHDLRVEALRHAAATGSLTRHTTATVSPPRAPERPLRASRPASERLWLPVAVVSCTAAAGVHAAVGPAHFREQTVLGMFFAVATLAQLGWSLAVVARVTPVLLRLGTGGNLALVGLWAASRTVGLPGVLPGPEAVGPWDLACVAWELVTVLACVEVLVGAGRPGLQAARVAGWRDWDRRARAWMWVSVVGLVLLSISGAGS